MSAAEGHFHRLDYSWTMCMKRRVLWLLRLKLPVSFWKDAGHS